MSQALPAVVLDNGSAYIKCGLGGTKLPACVVPTVVGRHVRRRRSLTDGSSEATTAAAAAPPSSSLVSRLRRIQCRQQQQRMESILGSSSSTTSVDAAQQAKGSLSSRGDGGGGGGGAPSSLPEVLLGEAALLRPATASDGLEVSRPVTNGIIHNMDGMQALWDDIFFRQLSLSNKNNIAGACDDGGGLSERSLLLSEVPLFSARHRSEVFEVLFESYGFARVQSAAQGALALFSSGLETGVAVECGDGLIHCTPIYEGYALTGANRVVGLGGRDVTRLLERLLQQHRGYRVQTSNATAAATVRERGSGMGTMHSAAGGGGGGGGVCMIDMETVRRIKERYCYAAVDLSLERHLSRETTTTEVDVADSLLVLPDGQSCTAATVRIGGPERYGAVEALFDPSLLDVESPGLSVQLWESVRAADMDIRSALLGGIVLSGGSSMFPGLSTRIAGDLTHLLAARRGGGAINHNRRTHIINSNNHHHHHDPSVGIEAPPRRRHAVFAGGAALADLTLHRPDMWISRAAWDEGGYGAVQARFGQR